MDGEPIDELLVQAIQRLHTRQFAESEKLCRVALAARPDHSEALHLMGVVSHRLGRSEQAIGWFEKSLAINPGQPRAHNNHGEVLRTLGRLDDAIAAYRRAVAANPAYPDARRNLASALQHAGDADAAILEAKAALEIMPQDPRVLNTLALAYAQQAKLDEALALLSRSIEIQPDRPATYSILGLVLAQRGDSESAVRAYGAAIRLRPTDPDAHTGLANALAALGRLSEAITAARQAIALSPQNGDFHVNLANILCRGGQVREGIESYRTALAIAPDSQAAHDGLLLTLHYDPETSPAALVDAHRRWGESLAIPPAVHSISREGGRRLRIGYASPDFREHPISFFIEPILASHDHDQFEIVCYSDVRNPDGVTARLQQYVHEWRLTVGRTDERWADLIRGDRIDILIDLANHAADNRMRGFARKPAPVQSSYLAYPGTTGLAAMDYKISDPHIDPPGESDGFATERIARLPDCYFCYHAPITSPPVSDPPATKNGYITFGSVNTLKKLNADVIETWSKLLAATPRSRLILQALGLNDPPTRQRYLDDFARHGIDAARLELLPFVGFSDFLRLFGRIDLALDPFPYNGGTTTLHTLWMGVPVVTLRGATPVSRMGNSVLTNAGLTDLIADTQEKYVAIAGSPSAERLTDLRRTMRDRLKSSPLLDAGRFTRNLELLYRRLL